VFQHLNRQLKSVSVPQHAVARDAATAESSRGHDGSGAAPTPPPQPTHLDVGMMELYSYYFPSLQAGLYDIEVKQTVRDPTAGPPLPTPAPTQPGPPAPPSRLPLTSKQQFNVNAPRFALPSNSVHQLYPPQGLGDHYNVLPHMVFEDANLPWERAASAIDDAEEKGAASGAGAGGTKHEAAVPVGGRTARPAGRNVVPWLALMTFSEDELKLTPTQLLPRSSKGMFPEGDPKVPPKVSKPNGDFPPPTPGKPVPHEQDRATFAVKLTMAEYLGLGHKEQTVTVDGQSFPVPVIVPVVQDGDIRLDQQVDTIFVPAALFENLFKDYDNAGVQTVPDLHRYKYLAHVRDRQDVENMTGASDSESGVFSVVHAHRIGPLGLTEPKPLIVHLVTLEGIEDNITFPLSSLGKTHVALVSLYSWTYLCLPPDSVNFIDTMRNIGVNIQPAMDDVWLRAPQGARSAVASSRFDTKPKAIVNRLQSRLKDGFVLQRYLLQTGERTVSFYRGPLTPNYVHPIRAAWWPDQTNFSTDYQILDQTLGIMDITYSAAWQLGRTLGTADQAFSAALVRLRSVIQTTARRGAMRKQAPDRAAKSKREVFHSLAASMRTLSRLSTAPPGRHKVDLSKRFQVRGPGTPTFLEAASSSSTATEPARVPVDAETVHSTFMAAHISRATEKMASGMAPGQQPPPPGVSDDDIVFLPYNELKVPASGDWKLVQDWIMNSLFFHNIPPHYLVPDPSFLPQESMRFFYIDSNWMDAFIDGALSIGNHLSQKTDVVRQAFKQSLNAYLSTPYRDDHPGLNYFPQVPCFGFLLRSSVVKAFPTLEVHAKWRAADDPGASRLPVLRLEALGGDVLLCLFDRLPGSPHWDPEDQITLSQPPHQQFFRLGGDKAVTTDTVEVSFRYLFTSEEPKMDPVHPEKHFDPKTPVAIITWIKGAGPGLPPLELLPLPPDASPEEKAEQQRMIDAHKAEEATLRAAALPANIFDWTSNTLMPKEFALACTKVLSTFIPNQFFNDPVPTSAVTATMLASHISQMSIAVPESSPGEDIPTQPPDPVNNPRQIRMGLSIPPNTDPSTWFKVPQSANPPTTTPLPAPPAPPPPDSHRARPWAPPFQPVPDAYVNKVTQPTIPPDQITNLDPTSNFLARECGPQYLAKAYALGTPAPSGPSTPGTIPIFPSPSDPRAAPIDLVIALTPWPPNHQPAPDKIHNLQLFQVEVTLPLGPGAPHLAREYAGPGAKMLANPRFNVHVTPLSASAVRFTLVPRARSRIVPLARAGDLSFAVWQVRPNQTPTGPGLGQRVRGSVRFLFWRRNRGMAAESHFGVAVFEVRKVLVP
jgi:hypothetical protein